MDHRNSSNNNVEKQFKSTNDIYSSAQSTNTVQEVYRSSGGLAQSNSVNHRNQNKYHHVQDGGEDSHRNSGISNQSMGSNDGSGVNMSRLVSGSKRNLPKVQRPLTRFVHSSQGEILFTRSNGFRNLF